MRCSSGVSPQTDIFLVTFKDLHHCSNFFDFHLFVDDTNLFPKWFNTHEITNEWALIMSALLRSFHDKK